MPRERRTNLSHTFTGLTPGITTMLVDNLWQFEINGVWKAVPKNVKEVNNEGTVRYNNLRDSIYSLLIVNFDYSQESRYQIQIGDPDLFDSISYHVLPSAVMLLSATAGQEGANIYVDLTWKLPPNGVDGFYHIYTREGSGGSWAQSLVINNPKQLYGRVEPLGYNTTYYFKIKSYNEDDRAGPWSNILSAITPAQAPADITSPTSAGWIT